MRSAQRQELCGIVVNASPRTKRRELERLEAILFNCARHGPAGQNRDHHPDFSAHFAGRLSWVQHVSPARAPRLRRLFEQIDWST